ncbi:putative peptidase [Corynebacterium occultum]|uniref:Putative peptidase n=1 Tax=Corynebacterium occultum TaxID=2675219 RepID=A0A6B8W326_9CORY|nr:M23 family metallopeptidase [Corynebacterium occultum]QGU07884.1 putative peptidase [Corynebacterium occultum]
MNAILLQLPLQGALQVRKSPATRVPSHGTHLFALAHSIDLVPLDEHGHGARYQLRSFFRSQAPEIFPGFGRAVLAPLSGEVVSAQDGLPDHLAHRGLPSIAYALTQARRAAGGFETLAGNHLIIRRSGDSTGHPADSSGEIFLALCHLRQGSIQVSPGQWVKTGQKVAECGNSGNSTEPHLHLQLMDAADPEKAQGVAFTFPGGLPRNGAIITAGPAP